MSEVKNIEYVKISTSGTSMPVINPQAFKDGGLEWQMRYGNAEKNRYEAASIISAYDYLCSDNITQTEAIRRLKMMRKKRSELVKARGE